MKLNIEKCNFIHLTPNDAIKDVLQVIKVTGIRPIAPVQNGGPLNDFMTVKYRIYVQLDHALN